MTSLWASRYVVFDLETNADRALVHEHEIIEVGAVLVDGETIKDRWTSLVKPTRPLSRAIQELTGITQDDLSQAPDSHVALSEFASFVGDLPLIAHNGLGYDFVVLDANCASAGLQCPAGLQLDLLELAHLAFPRAGATTLSQDGIEPPRSRQLSELAAHFGIDLSGRLHRALRDAEVASELMLSLLAMLNSDDERSQLQRWILQTSTHPWAEFLTGGDRVPLEDVIPPALEWANVPASGTFDPEEPPRELEPGGAFLDAQKDHRPQQVQMARRVAGNLAHGGRLLVEAPTGTGKTLAYLVPSLGYAKASGSPVVIATHSKVLQNQVLGTVREMELALGREVRAVLLKGRENYIDLESLEAELDALQDGTDDGLFLAIIARWVTETPTGEWDDLRAWSIEAGHPSWKVLRWRLTIDSAPGPARSDLDRRCFYRRALRRVGESDIAVMNHAILLTRTDWLDDCHDLVIDEAHNLEESATAAISEEVTESSIGQLLSTIRSGTGWGTVARFRDATDGAQSEVSSAVLAIRDQCDEAAAQLRDSLVSYVRDRSGARRATTEKYGASYRLRRGSDTTHFAFRAVRADGFALADTLRILAETLDLLVVPAQVNRPYRRHRLESEIARVGRTARKSGTRIAEVLACSDPDTWIHICDLTISRGVWSWGLRRVPVSVAGHLRSLWNELDSVALTSATLRIAGEWGYLIGRLGFDSAETLAVEGAFPNLASQHLMVLPDHLPTPSGGLLPEFAAAEAAEITRLLMVSRGSALVLMTARARLEMVKDAARPLLESHQLPLLAQGDAPASVLQERLAAERETSLLALRSFWEGIDIPGDPVSLLIIEKLPFEAPDDPITAARMEQLELQGRDPFGDYLIPQAVLRFVQGIGRLIRTPTDIGVSVILDKRLRRPVPYREQFLRSVPGPPRILRPTTPEEGYRAIAEHLGQSFDDDLLKLLESLPTTDPWEEISALEIADEERLNEPLVISRLEQVRKLFGFESWRPGQLEIMLRAIRGEDILGVLPTGAGKSLTFQLPALLLPGLTLVISPLIALMRDQVENLRGKHLTRVGAIYSGMPQGEQEEVIRGARSGKYKLLYVSPERLWSKRFRDGLKGVTISRVAIDEAHCISEWGHSFRPEYVSIPKAISEIGAIKGRVPLIALTATATPRVQEEIRKLLSLQGSMVIGAQDRPELKYYIEHCDDFKDRDLAVLDVLDALRGQPVIVYVPKRDDTTRLTSVLLAANHLARPYHGGMEPPTRVSVEEAFRYSEIDVVVATKAFGLGIDRPDIAAIVHLEMPASVEEYIQETGRCARGAVSGVGPEIGHCVLLSTPRDCAIHRQFVRSSAPSINLVQRVWECIRRGDRYFLPESLATEVGQNDAAEAVSLAVHYLVDSQLVDRGEDVMWSGRVWVPPDIDRTLEEIDDRVLVEKAIPILAGIRKLGTEEYDAIGWSRKLELDPDVLEGILLELYRRDVIGVTLWKLAWQLTARSGASPDWKAIEDRCEERRAVVRDLARQAKEYSTLGRESRRKWLMNYLGSDGEYEYGCDVTEPPEKKPWKRQTVTRDQIVDALPTESVCLSVLSDVAGAGFSTKSIVRCLAGRPFSFNNRLANHPAFGRLAFLGADGVQAKLDALEHRGVILRQSVERDGASYDTYILPPRIQG